MGSGFSTGGWSAAKHPVNKALGLHFSGRTLRPIVGRSVDREHLHHELIASLAGPAAGWVYAGERRAKRDPQPEAEARRHSDGGDDYSRVWNLVFDADPFDFRAATKRIPYRERRSASPEELMRSHGQPAVEAHTAQIIAKFEALWRETLAFVVEKWPHVQALADALWRKRRLAGEEVTEIIERIEDRIRSYPPTVQNVLTQGASNDEGIGEKSCVLGTSDK
jgi:hypothetical protein